MSIATIRKLIKISYVCANVFAFTKYKQAKMCALTTRKSYEKKYVVQTVSPRVEKKFEYFRWLMFP